MRLRHDLSVDRTVEPMVISRGQPEDRHRGIVKFFRDFRIGRDAEQRGYGEFVAFDPTHVLSASHPQDREKERQELSVREWPLTK
jgi:hypothetical protein